MNIQFYIGHSRFEPVKGYFSDQGIESLPQTQFFIIPTSLLPDGVNF